MDSTLIVFTGIVWLLVSLTVLLPILLNCIMYGAFDGFGKLLKDLLRNLIGLQDKNKE